MLKTSINPVCRWACLFGSLLAVSLPLCAADLADIFASRQIVDTSSGSLSGDNTTATIEEGEPRHGGKRPSHSLWISWIAPANGLAIFSTEGSALDSLLGIYQLETGTGPPIQRLRAIAGNDDERTNLFSRVEFAVRQGEQYEIALDGYSGATGGLQVEWELLPYQATLPRILSLDADRAVRAGDRVTLSIDVEPVPGLHLNWVFNDRELDNEENETLVITNFHATNAGLYRVEIDVGLAEFLSDTIEVQINSEGSTNTLARNKPGDALESPLIGSDGGELSGGQANPQSDGFAPASGGVTRGFNGTQIFHTVYAARDPLEPMHCGMAGGSSYWLAYVPPAAGRVRLDTDGSTYDTILAVYTFEAPFTSYADLIPVACDNNGGANGLTSRLEFFCQRDRTYFVVVDGVNGARGLVHLNYQLDTNSVPPSPPAFVVSPAPAKAQLGSLLTLDSLVSGTPPLSFQWIKDAVALPAATNTTLAFPSLRVEDAGRYSVEVTNAVGAITSAPVNLAVWSEPELIFTGTPPSLRLRFAAAGAILFQVERAETLAPTNWMPLPEPVEPVAGWVNHPIRFDTNTAGFFRVRFE